MLRSELRVKMVEWRVWKRGMEEQKKKAGGGKIKKEMAGKTLLPIVDGGPCCVLPSNFRVAMILVLEVPGGPPGRSLPFPKFGPSGFF